MMQPGMDHNDIELTVAIAEILAVLPLPDVLGIVPRIGSVEIGERDGSEPEPLQDVGVIGSAADHQNSVADRNRAGVDELTEGLVVEHAFP